MEPLKEYYLILLSTPLYIVIIGAEILLSNYGHKKIYSWKDTARNLYLMLLNSGVDILPRRIYCDNTGLLYDRHLISFHNAIVYWALLLLLEDFLYYWLHRFDHEIRLFWAVHVTHHSSEHMNFTVGFRSSVFQPLYRFVYFIPLALMGFKPLDILFLYSATQIWGILVHTELINKMGWLENILVTPSHHRVHHASNPLYLDKNMGMFLIIWDKIFGTFQPELPKQATANPVWLSSPIDRETPINIVFHEWKAIWRDLRRDDIDWKQKIKYLLVPDGATTEAGSPVKRSAGRKRTILHKMLAIPGKTLSACCRWFRGRRRSYNPGLSTIRSLLFTARLCLLLSS